MKPLAIPDETLSLAALGIHNGSLTAVGLLERCLARIQAKESTVKAWVLVDEEQARRQARCCDEESRAGRFRGPLHGIPLAIKDIIDVAGLPTRFGAGQWSSEPAREDATIVARLRGAGAVLLGKTTTTPYASFDPAVTRNPHNPDRTPGGSSAGSAAALAAGMCLGAIGTQTGGSLTRPATYCGVCCIKPTFGRVSLHGILPLAPSMDHAGVMGLTVRDTAALFDVMAGPDPRDPPCSWQPFEPCLPRVAAETRPPPRFGVLGEFFHDHADPAMREAFREAVERLRAAGADICEVGLPIGFDEIIYRHRIIMATEAAAYHEERFRRLPDDYPPEVTRLLGEGLAASAAEYIRSRQHQAAMQQAFRRCFECVDVLLVPATTGPAPAADTTGSPAFNSPISYLGVPTVSFPVGQSDDGLPLGVQVIGRAWHEADVFGAAAFAEAAIRAAP